MDYEVCDIIRLAKGVTVKKAEKSDNDYIMTLKSSKGSNKLTLKNVADKIITVVNYKDVYTQYNESTNSTAKAYMIEDRESEIWFAEDDKISSSGLDSILLNDLDSAAVTTNNLINSSSSLIEFNNKPNSTNIISYNQQK